MSFRLKQTAAALLATGALAAGIAAPANAHQQGLVNVEISNVANDNTVQITVPINAAANICGVSVAVLAEELESGPVSCDARGNQQVRVVDTA